MNQTAKKDKGKARLTLVPLQILYDIAAVREYGCEKYKDPDNWKRVEIERYRDAAFRHFIAYLKDPAGVDEESGLPHRWHLECNLAFLAELEKNNGDRDISAVDTDDSGVCSYYRSSNLGTGTVGGKK
jgi:hypothetical protein